MTKLTIGQKIQFESGLKYEIIKAFEGEYYDLKAMQPQFEWMPDFFPEYFSVKLVNYTIISDPICHNSKQYLCEGNNNEKYCKGCLEFY